MDIDSQAHLISIKIINGVEVSQESITNEEQVLIFPWKSTFVDDEIAFTLIALIKILLWIDFKDKVAHLETNWFDLGGNLLTWLLNIAESLI